MQLVTVSPGLRSVTLYSAEPASLSLTYTVPASKLLPLFDVLLLNAERVPTPTRAPTTPTISTERMIRLPLLSARAPISLLLPWPPWAVRAPAALSVWSLGLPSGGASRRDPSVAPASSAGVLRLSPTSSVRGGERWI